MIRPRTQLSDNQTSAGAASSGFSDLAHPAFGKTRQRPLALLLLDEPAHG
jgi:hypothetical protein